MQIIEPFLTHFTQKSLERFDADPSIIYGLTDELMLGLLNDAWFDVARANKAPPDFFERFGLGGSYVEGIDGPVRAFFESHLRQSMLRDEPWQFDYQCPAPGQFRLFRMQVLPLRKKEGASPAGCLVTNASIVEIPRPEENRPLAEDVVSSYLHDDQFITQCAHCRRTRRVDAPARWDWVPQLVWDPPVLVSHGLCPPCSAYLYH